jgi:Cu(I)/Ag(I) efflux system membrane fusion protein
VRAIEEAGRAFEQVTLTSPIAGTVLERHGDEGEYVEPGGLLYTIADLSFLWLELEAFERDLPWIEVGAPVSFQTPSHPGMTFEAHVSFIEPLLRPETRTVRVRVEVPNPHGRLKPGMFVTARVAGRPRAGWGSQAHNSAAPLVIPATAPLLTGRRAVVYVMDETADRPTFEGREVVLGPRAGDFYPVLEGLAEGELVVTRGAFKIDSALQILTRPSMLSLPAGDVTSTGAAPASAPASTPIDLEPDPEITRLLAAEAIPAYLDLATALGDDSFERAQAAWQRSVPALEAALAAGAGRDPRVATWLAAARAGATAPDIAQSRVVFEDASIAAIEIIRTHGNTTGRDLHIAHCPMTFDWKGSDWLQLSEDIHNPYFGAEMLVCGYVKDTLATAAPAAP